MPGKESATSSSSKSVTAKKREVTPSAKQGAFAPQGSSSLAALQQALAEPQKMRPADIVALQRLGGNRAVTQLFANHTLQAKLRVGAAHDPYEQEADRVAAQVMSMPEQASKVQRKGEEEEEEIQARPLAATVMPVVQRAVAPEEEELQAKFIQRDTVPEEEELQAKSINAGDSFEPSVDFESRLASTRGSGRPLPESAREFMEPRFGADFGAVRVHTDGDAAQLNREINAQAFTHGQDIYLGEGKDNIESNAGKDLLAHELTHTIQQGAAPIKRKFQTAPGEKRTTQIQRHGDAELEEQIKTAKLEEEDTIQTKRIDIQRHEQFPKHEPFRGSEVAIPPDKRWKLNNIVPETEQRRYKRAFLDNVEKLFSTDVSKRSKLRARIIGIKIEENPAFHSPAQGQPGKIIINPSSQEFYTPEGEPDVDAVRGTLIHEMFHSSSINHEGKDADTVMADASTKGFQAKETTLITQDEDATQETFDEAATEWFTMQVYKNLYPNSTYKSSYFTKAPKTKSGGGEGLEGSLNAGDDRPYVAESKDQVRLVKEALNISEEALMEMYLHDHAKLATLLAGKKDALRDAWRGHEQAQLREKFPLATNAGIKELIVDVIHEYEGELAECKDREAQLARLKEILKGQHNVEVDLAPRKIGKGHIARTLPATPGVTEALDALPAPGEIESDEVNTTTLNKGYIKNALQELKIKTKDRATALKFLLITPGDVKATTLDKYPSDRRFGELPAVPFPLEGNPYDTLKNFGGGGYEHSINTAFLINDHADSYHHYLHEVGHYKQHLQGYDETTVPNTILLDFHNILMNENTEKHIRTLYSTKSKMATLMTFKRQFSDVKNDVEGHKVMKKMFAEIEAKIAELKPIYQELYKRNLTYEYFHHPSQGGGLKAWKTP